MRRWQGSRRRSGDAPLGVVLAGGAGRRIGGAKAMVKLGGRPLITYPVAAMSQALGAVTVLAKIDSELPSLPGASVWIEPDAPRHPLAGIVHALELADGRAVMICAGDLPFVTPELIRTIAHAKPQRAPAVVSTLGGRLQPLLGCYQPAARELLAPVLTEGNVRLTDAVDSIGPRHLEASDPEALFNVNTPDDVLVAAGMLDRRLGLSRR